MNILKSRKRFRRRILAGLIFPLAILGFCLLVTIFAGYIGGSTLAPGTEGMQVFRVTATAAFMGFGFGALPNHIWWGESFSSTAKNLVDGIVYAVVTAAVFMWLWPH